MKIKLIIFDLSNVCFSSEEPEFIHNFCEKHKINENKFDEEYQKLLKKSEIDEISGINVWEMMLKKYSINENPQDIISEMMKGKLAHADVLNIAKKLKDEGYKVTYLTNYNKDYWIPITKMWDMDDYFSGGIVSYEIKARKPDVIGFKTLMARFRAIPEDTLFIDDSEGNLVEAGKLGIKTHHFKNSEELKIFLDKQINRDEKR